MKNIDKRIIFSESEAERCSGMLLSPSELAEKLGISRSSVYNMVRGSSIPYYCIGKRRVFDLGDIIRHIKSTRRG